MIIPLVCWPVLYNNGDWLLLQSSFIGHLGNIILVIEHFSSVAAFIAQHLLAVYLHSHQFSIKTWRRIISYAASVLTFIMLLTLLLRSQLLFFVCIVFQWEISITLKRSMLGVTGVCVRVFLCFAYQQPNHIQTYNDKSNNIKI